MKNSLPTHAVKAVIKNEKGELLFLRRRLDLVKKTIDNWDLPGGIVEDGEDDKEALRRELKEELGVEARIGEKAGIWSFHRPLDEKTVNVTNYFAELSSRDITLSEEHTDYKWLTPSELAEIAVKDVSIYDALGA